MIPRDFSKSREVSLHFSKAPANEHPSLTMNKTKDFRINGNDVCGVVKRTKNRSIMARIYFRMANVSIYVILMTINLRLHDNIGIVKLFKW